MELSDKYVAEAYKEDSVEDRQAQERDAELSNDCPPFGPPPPLTDEEIQKYGEQAWGKV